MRGGQPKKIEEACRKGRHCTSHFREWLIFVVSPLGCHVQIKGTCGCDADQVIR
jgi:hypothetical protein